MLSIKNLSVRLGEKEILKNLNLEVKKGERHVIFGPNATGKSTLASVIMGIPNYKIMNGKIFFEKKDITNLPMNKRAKLGIFLAFQNSPEIRGLKINSLLQLLTKDNPKEILRKAYLDESFLHRDLHGFSGGEKKRIEIAQAFAVKPKLLIIDEIDSGVDIESLKLIGNEIRKFLKETKSALIAITHYGHILEYLEPHKAHVMISGKIACSDKPDYIWGKIMKRGYGWCERCPKMR